MLKRARPASDLDAATRVVCDGCSVLLRERLESDRDACVEMARAVHERDRYPMYLPSDLASFIFTPGALGAWVAEEDGEVAGHVALHSRSSPAVLALAQEATGLSRERLCVVARLLVSPRHRRRGIGRALLEAASDAALARRLRPVLDVVRDHEAAVAFYERSGWVRAGEVTVRWGDHPEVQELVYLGPELALAP
jgi:GNAT superfamily N-acetyltransferase